MKEDRRLIEVCSSCLTACCWHADCLCFNAKHSGTELKTVKQLNAANMECKDNYSVYRMLAIYGDKHPHGFIDNEQ